jgi:Xaa-Pro dipeptidase
VSAEIDEKTARLVEMLSREKLGGVLLNSRHNFAWLTAGGNNGIDLGKEGGVAALLITTQGRRYVLANNIEMPRLLAEELSESDFEPVVYGWQQEKERSTLSSELAEGLSPGPVASDIGSIAAAQNIEGLIAKCRASLTSDETERIRALGKDAGEAMNSLIAQLSPGECELEIAEKMRAEFSRSGMSLVVTLVAADARIAKFRHPLPGEERWEKTLLLVACAKRSGLIVSLSRMVVNSGIPDDLARRTEAAAFVNANLWHRTRPGTSGAELYQVAAGAYRTAGFEGEIDKHHQGGAAGYRTRDWVAHPACNETVQSNQAFAWNPSVTGTKVEETIISSETGIEVLTASTSFPTIPNEIEEVTYNSPGILSL